MKRDLTKDIQEPINRASPAVQKIIAAVLEVEKQKLYQDRPRIIQDIINIVKKVVE